MIDLGFEPRLEPPESKAVQTCSECGEPIYEGEVAYHFPGWGWVCEGCVRSAMEVAE